MLKLSKVSIELNKDFVIEDLDLELNSGEIALLQCKTETELDTFISLLQGRLSPSKGLYEFMGEDVSKFSNTRAASFRKTQLVYVKLKEDFEQNITVEKLLQQPLRYSGIYPSKWKRRLNTVSQLLDIKDIMTKAVSELNSTEALKAYIGKGIVLEPKLVLMRNPILFYTDIQLAGIKVIVDIMKSIGIALCFLDTDIQLQAIVEEHYVLS